MGPKCRVCYLFANNTSAAHTYRPFASSSTEACRSLVLHRGKNWPVGEKTGAELLRSSENFSLSLLGESHVRWSTRQVLFCSVGPRCLRTEQEDGLCLCAVFKSVKKLLIFGLHSE